MKKRVLIEPIISIILIIIGLCIWLSGQWEQWLIVIVDHSKEITGGYIIIFAYFFYKRHKLIHEGEDEKSDTETEIAHICVEVVLPIFGFAGLLFSSLSIIGMIIGGNLSPIMSEREQLIIGGSMLLWLVYISYKTRETVAYVIRHWRTAIILAQKTEPSES